MFAGEVLKLQLWILGEPNSLYTPVCALPGCKGEEPQAVTRVASSTSVPTSLAVDQCEITEIVDAITSGEQLVAIN
jgi:hypothetical protein